jgi:hypothetical protein
MPPQSDACYRSKIFSLNDVSSHRSGRGSVALRKASSGIIQGRAKRDLRYTGQGCRPARFLNGYGGPLEREWNMSKKPACGIFSDDTDIFIQVDGVNVAKRGKPGTPQAKTWISLEPGWAVTSNANMSELEVSFIGTPIN